MKNRKTALSLAVLVALFFAVGPVAAASPQISCDASQTQTGETFNLESALEQDDPWGCYEIYCSNSMECYYTCGGPAICVLDGGWPGYCIEL